MTKTQISELRSYLLEHFVIERGRLKRVKFTHPNQKAICYGKTSFGYYCHWYKDRMMAEHRLIYLICHGNLPDEVDHINGKVWDNRPSNLRAASKSNNMANTRKTKRNTSGYKGVSYTGAGKLSKPWAAEVRHQKKRYFIGRYKTPEEAHMAYCKKAKELHGEFFNSG